MIWLSRRDVTVRKPCWNFSYLWFSYGLYGYFLRLTVTSYDFLCELGNTLARQILEPLIKKNNNILTLLLYYYIIKANEKFTLMMRYVTYVKPILGKSHTWKFHNMTNKFVYYSLKYLFNDTYAHTMCSLKCDSIFFT